MRPGGIEEIIYQFAGYFDLVNEVSRARVEYDGEYLPRSSQDFDSDIQVPTLFVEDLEPLGGTRLIVSYRLEQPVNVEVVFDESFPFNRVAPRGNDAIQDIDIRAPKAGLEPIPFDVQLFMHAEYSEGGNQAVIHAQQFNRLVDNDSAGITGDDTIAYLAPDTTHALSDLYHEAGGEIPAELDLSGLGTGALVDFFAARNAAWKDSGDNIKGGVEPGAYLNGVLQDEDAPLPVEPDPVEPVLTLGTDDSDILPDDEENQQVTADGAPDDEEADDDEPNIHVAVTEPDIAEPQEAASSMLAPADAPAQTAILGANDIVNAGAIVDVNAATGTMVVFGDFFKTDIIAQSVAYMDDDHVTYAGAGDPDIETGGNQANNLAQFLETDPGVGSFAGTGIFAGSDWKVDVFHGDMYDVRSLTQKIWLEDNDISFQENEQTHYQVLAGANEQGNLAIFDTVMANYDLVLVMGDYHQANVIVQKMVLLDPDTLQILASTDIPQDGDPAGAAASTGANWMLNDATIENYSTSVINPVTPELEGLAGELLDQTESIETDYGFDLPNFGDPTFDVLVVTGSIFDLNVINQEIVVSDADTAMQMLSGGASDVAQAAITGSNHLTNEATIISTGPAADFYVGGGVYDEEMLINADFIASDDDDVIHGDPSQLASELVVFASAASAEEDSADEQYASTAGAGQADLLGGTMG